ncbi:MAG: 3-dehydroquinate synthase, partial [Planctomycetia bacterium]|nr:3-dehydroquinate synthase [Planctomycetia bacterium]
MPIVTVQLKDRSYPVRIDPGAIAEIGAAAQSVAPSARAVVITDTRVAGLYLADVLASLKSSGISAAETIALEPGEGSKTLEVAREVYEQMLERGMERGSLVIGLGGGVVTDLAGFVAATYMRGLAWIAVPSTLLGQVDAAIGGKTGVDLPQGKNLVGAFHQPRAVIVDTATLKTLDKEEVANGLAEVVKHAVIRDAQLFGLLEENVAPILQCDERIMTRVVAENVRIKADVVAQDETETGMRAILNYGHTVGHAIEAAGAYKGLRHGQA